MKRLLFFVILSCFSFSILAQVNSIKGKIIDQESGEGIAYTNIGIEGTMYGTASDNEGLFELKIPEGYENANIYFSAVGYTNRIIVVREFSGRDFVTIPLREQTYGIEGIDVAAQSKVLFRIIRTASEKIKNNYPEVPVGLKIYFTENLNGQKREAVVQMNDTEAYRNPSVLNAFKCRNYRFTEAKRDFEVYSFPQGTTGFDELLEADIARMGNTILNENLISDYDLQLEKSTVFNGDSVWVIDYKTNKTDLAHTGTYGAIKFSGKIFISKTDYGIVRNELEIESAKQNPQGRSLAVGEKGNTNVTDNITVGYKKSGDKYILSFIDSKKQYTTPDRKQLSVNRTLTVMDIQNGVFPNINSRDYFDNVEFNTAFWGNFIRPKN